MKLTAEQILAEALLKIRALPLSEQPKALMLGALSGKDQVVTTLCGDNNLIILLKHFDSIISRMVDESHKIVKEGKNV